MRRGIRCASDMAWAHEPALPDVRPVERGGLRSLRQGIEARDAARVARSLDPATSWLYSWKTRFQMVIPHAVLRRALPSTRGALEAVTRRGPWQERWPRR